MKVLRHSILVLFMLVGALAACNGGDSDNNGGPGDAGDDTSMTDTSDTMADADAGMNGGDATASCDNPTELDHEAVNGGQTLPANTCYSAPENLTVDDGTLTIEEGVTIQFDQGVQMVVEGDGRLNASGADGNPVRLTGMESSRGYWKGISVTSQGTDNQFDYVVLEHAGGGTWTGAPDSAGALWVRGGSMQITNTTFRENSNWALQALGDDISGFANNTFENNETPIHITPDLVGSMDGSSVFTGNDNQRIEIDGEDLNDDATWQAFDVPYRLDTRLRINAAWTLEEGVTIVHAQDVFVRVNSSGSLTAVGGESAEITLRGVEPLRGHWRGLSIESQSASNQLDKVIIQHAGSDPWTGDPTSYGALRVTGKAEITSSTFKENAETSLRALSDADLSGFSSNLFENNALPMWVAPDRLGEFDGSSVFESNDSNHIAVSFGNLATFTSDATIKNVGIPYRFTDRTFVEAALTVQAGVTLEFQQDVQLVLSPNEGGTLTLDGTSDDQVSLVGVEDLQGYWKGLSIETSSADNVFRNTLIANAGSSTWTGDPESDASVIVGRQFGQEGRLEVDTVEIRDSGGNAVLVPNGTVVGCSTLTTNNIEDAAVVTDGNGTTDC